MKSDSDLFKAACCVVFFLSADVGIAQRPAPKIADYGIPATGETVSNRMVLWDFWSIEARECARTANATECSFTLGNGTNDPHSLCVSLTGYGNVGPKDSVRMQMVHPSAANRKPAVVSLTGFDCQEIAAHSWGSVSLRSITAFAGRPDAITLILAEPVAGAREKTFMKATAKIPIGFLKFD